MFSSVLLFFEFGGGEIMFIFMVALLLFGGDKLPGLARGLGKGIRDFKDASEGVKREINNQIDNFESKNTTPPSANTIAETATLAAAVIDPSAPVIEPPANAVPVAEISSVAEVEPVKEENTTPSDLGHLTIDNNAPQVNNDKATEPAHNEVK
jgi:sec-independent protein translocase protein TatA